MLGGAGLVGGMGISRRDLCVMPLPRCLRVVARIEQEDCRAGRET